ncbi:MAG: DMT family transporter [Gemmatimonadota bacterium]|nr:DMT family transporter [Gemmatimonadota bacterium]MDH4349804.1 DMT family transporter [Gemmatimonadota bacterium]MDH5196042.1 DMT family transporter [Gemmatimonadota bacterium]
MTLPVLVWLLLATIWGSTWLFIKVGLMDLPPFSFAAWRFVLASIPLLIWLVLRRPVRRYAAADWRLMIGTGLLTFALNYTLVFWGESHISAGLAAILYSTFPVLGMLMAHWMLPAEPLTMRKFGGALVAVGGVAVIFYDQIHLRGAWAVAGSAAVVIAATSSAYAGVLIKRQGTHIDPVVMTAVQMLASVGPMMILGLAVDGDPRAFAWTPRAVLSVVYLALLGSSLTFVLLYWLMQRIPVTRVMLIPLFSTLIAVALDAAVLGEQLHWRALVGAAGILGGLAAALAPHPEPPQPA